MNRLYPDIENTHPNNLFRAHHKDFWQHDIRNMHVPQGVREIYHSIDNHKKPFDAHELPLPFRSPQLQAFASGNGFSQKDLFK